MRRPPGSRRAALRPSAGMACWVAAGMVVAASVWASEPGAADPPASTWAPGLTVTTWDWERHWNHWMEWVCSSVATAPGIGNQVCYSWSRVGPAWKPCGPEVRPPQPGRINTCNIGQSGGHRPHGDNIRERYTYLGQHEDRTGPTYLICADDPALPADTSPGNCGTWVEFPHSHCPGDAESHPPDCPPVATLPAGESTVCADPAVAGAFKETVDRQPDPGHGLQPSANGYVRVPLSALYPHDPVIRFSARIGDDTVDLRMWITDVTWFLSSIGTIDGSDLGVRNFRRRVPDRDSARDLNMPTAVIIGGRAAVYLRSSLRAGYPAGYPVTVAVTWRADCRKSGSPDSADMGEEVRRFAHRYKVYEIRSRPELVGHFSHRGAVSSTGGPLWTDRLHATGGQHS